MCAVDRKSPACKGLLFAVDHSMNEPIGLGRAKWVLCVHVPLVVTVWEANVLKRITIDGFKSVRERTDLRMAPLTVFTGANSSGKSTVLQTLLLQTQTLQSTVHSASVVLNGHIVRLGKFTDIASMGKSDPITLGFELVPGPGENLFEGLPLTASTSLLMHPGWFQFLKKGELTDIRCEFSFLGSSASEEGSETWNLEPVVTEASLSVGLVQRKLPKRTSVKVARSRKTSAETAQELRLENPAARKLTEYLKYDVQEHRIDRERTITLSSGREARYSSKYVPRGVRLYHFIPDSEVTVVDEVAEFIASFRMFLHRWEEGSFPESFYPLMVSLYESDPKAGVTFEDRFRSAMLAAIDRVMAQPRLGKKDASALVDARSMVGTDAPMPLSDFFENLSKIAPRVRGMLLRALDSPKGALRKLLVNHRDPQMALVPIEMDPGIEFAAAYARGFFSQHLKYIGPLRDQPRAVYPLSGYVMSERDVGFRGENTAAVLHNFRDLPVSNVSLDSLATDPDHVQSIEEPLKEAVRKWLKYLSVAESIRTEDEGTQGHGVFAISSEGAGEHDLSHLGVGVSQVLPLIVESLLADRGSVLLFEQPELHLHPKVQSRLADFFFALTTLGKQCIVETHSEYLINRLRYLRARAVGDTLDKSLLIYFVESRNGGSSFREVHMDKYGAIDEWPDGFFDEGERLASEIAEAGLTKSRRTTKHENH